MEIFEIGTGEVMFLVVLLGAAAVGATVVVRALLRTKPLTCSFGVHAWHAMTLEGHVRAIVCLRCGKQEIPDANVAIRLGWDQHAHG